MYFLLKLKNSFSIGAKIDFKNEDRMKIASQILKRIITASVDSSLFQEEENGYQVLLVLLCFLTYQDFKVRLN